jgi:DNA-binding CsgD family transcriptional regulator/PAS domain-containing protein
MQRPNTPMSPAEFSSLVSAIYDCVFDPDLWPDVLRRIGETVSSAALAITLIERDGTGAAPFRNFGITPEWGARYKQEYGAEAAGYFELAMVQPGFDFDAPLVLSRIMPPAAIEQLAVVREWAGPQGFVDNMSAVIMTSPMRIASVDVMRHKSVGPIDDHAIDVMKLLLPHLRRAFTISDLMGLQRLEASVLRSVLDSLSIAVVLVDCEARVLQANLAARGMLDRATPVRQVLGRLAGETAVETRRLRQAIAEAHGSEASLTAQSTGISLLGGKMPTVVAHVLPLGVGKIRSNVLWGAAAAVFIAGADAPPRAALDGIAVTYGLTETEQRLLHEVATGASVAQASATLKIAVGTGRTHMKHLYGKLGVHSHSELVVLVNRLASPLRT